MRRLIHFVINRDQPLPILRDRVPLQPCFQWDMDGDQMALSRYAERHGYLGQAEVVRSATVWACRQGLVWQDDQPMWKPQLMYGGLSHEQ